MRSALTLLGIVIGIMAIVGMTSVLRGLDLMMTKDLRSLSPSLMYVVKFGGRVISSHREFMRLMSRPNLTEEDARAIEKHCKSVKKVDILRGGGFPPKFFKLKYKNTVSKEIEVFGTSEYYQEVFEMPVEKGRFFTEAEVLHRRNVIVLGYSPAKGLFDLIDPIGKEVKMGNQKYTVIGTFAKRVEGGLDTGADDFAIIPHTTFKKYYSTKDDSIMMAVMPIKDELAEQARDEVIAVMRMRHNLKSWQENDFDILTKDSILELWRDVTQAIVIGLMGISSVALLVGGVGVMAIMMVSVTERTREIGIRKAIGAKKRHILGQFLIEAVIITSIGGVLGVIAGASVAVLISLAIGFPVSLPWWSFVIGVIFSALVGIFSGIYPAYRAAKLDPIVALHYE
jgi:putative ABC transport system permease protein